ncbi:MAG TPA: hypothetical protein VJB67_00785 [Patescibacteria group bacterium]|nr:hypothetical protein [Patescibacteria group bacterium]
MKIQIPDNLNPLFVIRRASYGQVRDRRASQASFARRLGFGIYPRFHAYINGQVINLHLDQKQASYQGSNMHSGEYDGETVENEASRIQQIIESLNSQREVASTVEEKKGFWSGLFGK